MTICTHSRPNRRRSTIMENRLRTACIFMAGAVTGQLITMWLAGIL